MVKYELIPAQLIREGIVPDSAFLAPEMVSVEILKKTHAPSYCNRLLHLSVTGDAARRIGLPLSAELVARERRIVQGTIDACQFALQDGVAFNVAGGTHHAGSDWGEGFCLFNDQAVAANYLLHHNVCKRILIIDLDVHQGNGTAEIFRSEERVFTFSMHAERNFPFRKERSDLDIGLPDHLQDEAYLALLAKHLGKLFETAEFDFVFYQSGVDVLKTDKLGKLDLSREGCRLRDELVFLQCRRAGVPIQVSMGGGYSPSIRDIVDAHCNTFRAAVRVLG